MRESRQVFKKVAICLHQFAGWTSHVSLRVALLSSFIIPLPMAATAQTITPNSIMTQGTQSSEEMKYFEYAKIIRDIQKLTNANPEDPMIKSKRIQAERILGTITADLSREYVAANGDPMKQMRVTERSNFLRELSGIGGISQPVALLVNPRGVEGEHDFAKGEISMTPDGRFAVEKETSKFVNMSMAALHKAKSGAIHFSTQYATFAVAMGFVTLGQMFMTYKHNPNAFELWKQQMTDIVGAAGFGMFIIANHQVIRLLNSASKGTMPRSLQMYIGMAAGSVASSMFHDLWTDKDVWTCVKNHTPGNKAAKDPEACRKAFTTWMVHNKILQYTPTIMSMLASTAIAQAIRSKLLEPAAAGIASKTGISKKKYFRAVIRGAKVMSKADWARRGYMTVAGGLPGAAVAVGDFVFFLAIDVFVTAEPSQALWSDINMNWVDIKSHLEKSIGIHSEFFWPQVGSLQPIKDALDVEATNPYTAHNYLMGMYNKMQETGWAQPADIQTCLPPSIKEMMKTENYDRDDSYWWWSYKILKFGLGLRNKSNAQLSCEVYSRPEDLISRYADQNAKWRESLLSSFSLSQQNWTQTIHGFSQMFEATYTLGKYLADAKLKYMRDKSQKPNLSREAILKIVSTPVGEHDEKFFASKVSSVPTPELADYILAKMACSTSVANAQVEDAGYLSKAWSGVRNFIGRTGGGETYMATPFGSSIVFNPPRLVTNKEDNICETTISTLPREGEVEPDTGLAKPMLPRSVTDTFNGPFNSNDGKTYDSIAQYVFDNFDPSIYESEGNYSSFPKWWNHHLVPAIEPVWNNYAEVYEELINEDYLPKLFDYSFRYGCPATMKSRSKSKYEPDSTSTVGSDGLLVQLARIDEFGGGAQCKDSSVAYRVGNGVFLSIEIEARNYIRGLYSILMASYPAPYNSSAAKEAFMAEANQIIAVLRSIDKETVKSDELESQLADAQTNIENIKFLIAEAQENTPSAKNEFRAKMADLISGKLGGLFVEAGRHASTVHMMSDFSGAANRGGSDNLQTQPGNKNPLMRFGR